MHKFWNGVAVFFAGLLVIAMVLLATIAVLLVNIDRELLNAGIYKNALVQQQVLQSACRASWLSSWSWC